VKQYKVVTITHKTTKVNRLKDYLLADDDSSDFPVARLSELKSIFNLSELLYLNTCNRVTFFFTCDYKLNEEFLERLFLFINPSLNKELIQLHVSKAMVYEGRDAIRHLFGVVASLDSLVVGEREILGQIKFAYQNAKQHKLSGDSIRLAIEQAIVFAKKIHTETKIGEKPISVVSLAYRSLLEKNLNANSKIIIIGAGQTNNLMANLLVKNHYNQVTIYNRTLSKAEDLASRFKAGKAMPLEMLPNHQEEFDVIISCTGANHTILHDSIFNKIHKNDKKVIIVDLAVPQDIDKSIATLPYVHYIDIASLEQKANENLQFRKGEMYKAEAILEDFINTYAALVKERKLELALANIPSEVKEIKHTALEKAFKKDIDALDDNAREILYKVMGYMEEKYTALPFKASKESLLNQFNA
jgi:glutamyl-tRNA reductase